MDKAKAEFASLAAKYPKNASVQKGYIRVLLQVKDYATARTVVAGLMKNNPKDPEVAALNGIVLLNDGKASDAVNALMNGAKDFPKDAFIQYWLGKAALAKGDIALAEKSFRQAAELNPSALDAQEELARIAGQRGDMNLLADVADKTIAAAPHFPGGYVWRAMVEMRHNAADKAEADLKTAMSTAPQSPQAYLQLGKLRFAQKRFPEGVSLLEQALQYDPNSVEAMRLLIGYDLYQKQPDKALARLNAQIAKSPKNSSFYDLLAQLEIQDKKLDQAAATAQKAIQLNSGDGEAVMLFAQIAGSARTDGQCHQRLGAVAAYASQRCRCHCDSRNTRGIAWRSGQGRGLLQEIFANPAAAAYRSQQSCLSNATEWRKRGCGLDTRANGPAGYAELTQYRRHAGVGLLLQRNLRICPRPSGGRSQDRTEQCHNAVSPGNGVRQTSG